MSAIANKATVNIRMNGSNAGTEVTDYIQAVVPGDKLVYDPTRPWEEEEFNGHKYVNVPFKRGGEPVMISATTVVRVKAGVNNTWRSMVLGSHMKTLAELEAAILQTIGRQFEVLTKDGLVDRNGRALKFLELR